uniref:Uncharacterized protein n=1 Tax=Molossus molossus TaxID=27622 RepID=A0A7J8IZS6_MOLMO|nr:hypothetical protein HJG59_010438 [Molossus molossus]
MSTDLLGKTGRGASVLKIPDCKHNSFHVHLLKSPWDCNSHSGPPRPRLEMVILFGFFIGDKVGEGTGVEINQETRKLCGPPGPRVRWLQPGVWFSQPRFRQGHWTTQAPGGPDWPVPGGAPH